ncbi:MAG: formylglycine-generating enzyme family protein [Cyanobacteria bacterium P01_A01_bin.84]
MPSSNNHKINQKLGEKFTHPHLKSFGNRFGRAYLDLACHAAFPLALTPELLYCLRENFQNQVPWIAVSDIILSLCDPVGFELYELKPEVRHELIATLKKDFGEKRLCQLSDFMVAYIRQKLKTNYRADEDLGAAPHWTALAYFKPEEAIEDIAKALEKALAKQNPHEWVKLTSLIESYADVDPLIESGFQPLLVFARGCDAQARGDTEIAEDNFAQLRRVYGENLQIGEVQFKIPTLEDDNLQIFEFEVVTVNRNGEIINRETKQARYFTEDLGIGITLDMVYIPGGTFIMGTQDEEIEWLVKKFGRNYFRNEKPQHEVTVQPFFMGKYQVTQKQWKAVATLPKINRDLQPEPSYFKGDNLPVEQVNWYDAVEFCDRISQHTGKQYRLYSEAEWEYACRAGTATPYHFGETITSELANYHPDNTFADEFTGEYREKTTPVGQFSSNAFGIYDMHGNVDEWCLDDWHLNYEGAPTDGSAWFDNNNNLHQKKETALLRGGSWFSSPGFCRSASRYFDDRMERVSRSNFSIGFRVACEVENFNK